MPYKKWEADIAVLVTIYDGSSLIVDIMYIHYKIEWPT